MQRQASPEQRCIGSQTSIPVSIAETSTVSATIFFLQGYTHLQMHQLGGLNRITQKYFRKRNNNATSNDANKIGCFVVVSYFNKQYDLHH